MRLASKKHSQNVNARGNVPKSLTVSSYLPVVVLPLAHSDFFVSTERRGRQEPGRSLLASLIRVRCVWIG